MKQAFTFLALVALSQYFIGSGASGDSGGKGRRHRFLQLPQGDAFLEKSSSGLRTTMLWSRVHSAEALAETEREALVAQQEALQALQKEQEALAAKEATMETKLEKLQGSPESRQTGWSAPPMVASPIVAIHSQVTRGVEFAIDKQHPGHRADRGSGQSKNQRQGFASLWGRWAHLVGAGVKEHSAHDSTSSHAMQQRTNGVSFLIKDTALKHQELRTKSAQETTSSSGRVEAAQGQGGSSTRAEASAVSIESASKTEASGHFRRRSNGFWESVEDAVGLPTSTSYGRRLWGNLATCGFFVVQAFICGVVYEQCCKVPYPLVEDSKVHHEEWQFGLLQCRGSRDWRICLCAFCCPSVRWADTVSRLQYPFMGFLPALFVFSLLEGATGLTFGASGVILFLMVVLSRLRIREEYGIVHGECGFIGDCLIWCFCAPCAIVQEARQVEYVKPPVFEDY